MTSEQLQLPSVGTRQKRKNDVLASPVGQNSFIHNSDIRAVPGVTTRLATRRKQENDVLANPVGQNSFTHNTDIRTVPRVVTRRNQEKDKHIHQNTVIALPATNAEDQIMKGGKKRKRNSKLKSGKAEETADVKETDHEEEEEYDVKNCVPNLVKKLKRLKDLGLCQEKEEVAMIPNPRFKEFSHIH